MGSARCRDCQRGKRGRRHSIKINYRTQGEGKTRQERGAHMARWKEVGVPSDIGGEGVNVTDTDTASVGERR